MPPRAIHCAAVREASAGLFTLRTFVTVSGLQSDDILMSFDRER